MRARDTQFARHAIKGVGQLSARAYMYIVVVHLETHRVHAAAATHILSS